MGVLDVIVVSVMLRLFGAVVLVVLHDVHLKLVVVGEALPARHAPEGLPVEMHRFHVLHRLLHGRELQRADQTLVARPNWSHSRCRRPGRGVLGHNLGHLVNKHKRD